MSSVCMQDQATVTTLKQRIQALLVEDHEPDALFVRRELAQDPLLDVELTCVTRLSDALDGLARVQFDIVLTDLGLPDGEGLDTFKALHAAAPDLPIIVMTGTDDPLLARKILRTGAEDCLTKGRNAEVVLGRAVRHAIERHHFHAELNRQSRTLAQAQQNVKDIIEASADAAVIVGTDGLVRFANPAAEKLFGRPAGLVGHSFGFPVAGSGEGKSTELDIVRSDGSTRIAGMLVSTLIWEGETAYLAALRDLTDRVNTEQQLKRTLTQLRAIVGNAPIFLWALDGKGVVMVAEGKLLDKLGATEQQLVGKSLFDRFSNNPQLIEATSLALRGQAVHRNIEVEQLVIEIWHSPVLDDYGRLNGTIGVGIDVTDRVRLEAQFRQAQKMEAVGRLAGGIAHDFNNLLTVIGSFSSLALEQLDGFPKVQADLKQIQRAAESAARLTSQLLAFSRRQILQPRPLDLNQEVSRIDAILRRLIGEDIVLETRLDPMLKAIMADPGQIEQIIMNLAVNARDAMPRGGNLAISTRNEFLDDAFVETHHGASKGPCVLLTVCDTGIGMDAPTLRSIFEPFFTTKALGKGTGLGLATVYGIVKQSGGSIWVESELGRGTKFKIYLPVVAEPAPVSGEGEKTGGKLAGTETILIVEDQDAIRQVATTYLEQRGYTVLAAPDGGQAIHLCDQYDKPIHMLVSDVVMPVMSGRELARQLHTRRPQLRVLYMSGYTDETIAQHGVLETGVAFLQKPFTLAALSKRIREVLDSAEPPAV